MIRKLNILTFFFSLFFSFIMISSNEKNCEKLPVLIKEDVKFHCGEVLFKYDRDFKSTVPLQLVISTLGSKGITNEIRVATLQAALVAGLCKNDTLNGIMLSIDSKDNFDGESFSFIASLSILSFLNKTALPNDIAFIGKLMPDGSIGNENHLSEKIRAFALSGKKRIIVPFNNKNVKYKTIALGKELGIELIVANNFEEAYDKIFVAVLFNVVSPAKLI